MAVPSLDPSDALTARSNLAEQLGEAGDPRRAALAFETLVAEYEQVLGPDHLDTLAILFKVAYWRSAIPDPPGTLAAFEALVAARLRVLGADHPDTLAAQYGLAQSRGEAGALGRRPSVREYGGAER